MKNKHLLFPILMLSGLAWTGCGGNSTGTASSQPKQEQAAPPAAAPASVPLPAGETAPAVFKAALTTTKGEFVVEAHREWSPNGADRFYNMVKSGFLSDVAFFRVVPGFMAQFGIHGDPAVMAKWRPAQIPDDANVGQSNKRGMVTFATAGPNTRTTQIFVNFGDNVNLDSMGFTPFGKIISGMDVVDSLYKGYGDGPPYGAGVDQGRFQAEGNAYLKRDFPQLDYIKSARLAN